MERVPFYDREMEISIQSRDANSPIKRPDFNAVLYKIQYNTIFILLQLKLQVMGPASSHACNS